MGQVQQQQSTEKDERHEDSKNKEELGPSNESLKNIGSEDEKKEYDPHRRVEEYLKKYETHKEKYSNPAKLFRNEFFLGLNQKIHDKVFFDNGRTNLFRPLEEQKEIISMFDTTVSDPQNDKKLESFLEDMKKKYKEIIPSTEPSREALEEKILNLSRHFISEVISFFGGLNFKTIKPLCDETIKRIKRERNSNIIYLGDVQGFGVCRHRVILFKLLCDTFNVPCRILRGWMEIGDRKGAHAWNEIVLKNESYIVDTMNFNDFVFPTQLQTSEGFSIRYINLGHPHRSLEIQKETIDHIKKLYTEENLRKGEHLGQGAFGNVYEILDIECKYEVQSEDERERAIRIVRKNLAVKEVNLTQLGLLFNDDQKERIERTVKRELKMMTLFQHPNIVKVIGSFSTTQKFSTYIRLVMEKYDMNGLSFMGWLQHMVGRLTPERLTIEVLIFLLEVVKGLSFIHSFGVIHFDIKPQNILLNWSKEYQCISNVVISDFGSSKEEKMNLNLTSSPDVTKQFADPNILQMIKKKEKNEEIDPSFVFSTKSDIYSFGILLGYFLKYLKEYPNLFNLQQQCLSKKIEERPEINEIKEEIYKIISTKKKIVIQNTFGGLYTWGSGFSFQLGHDELINEFLPRFVSSLSSFDVKNVFCGYKNCSVLLSNEEVLSWGSNKYSQLGKKTEDRRIRKPSIQPNNMMKLPENRKIIQVSHGSYYSFYLDTFGDIWGCGSNSLGYLTGKRSSENISSPFLITSKSKEFQKIKSIHCHNFSFGCVSFDGKLFTWGKNFNGRLFHSKSSKYILSPTLVEYFCDVLIKQIAIGVFESLVLTEDGKVYSSKKYWKDLEESNEENTTSSLSFGLISFGSEDCKITKISAGIEHFGALDSFGNCYMWGKGSVGQLGNGSTNDSSFPFRLNQFYNFGKLTSLEIPSKHKFIQFKCGYNHTIALLEEKLTPNESKFHVLTWGRGEEGQLGTKNIKFKKNEVGTKYFPFPVIVPFFEDKIVKCISSKGTMCSAIVLNPKKEKNQKKKRNELIMMGDY